MGNIFRSLKRGIASAWSKLKHSIRNTWLKIRLKYWVHWIKRASVREQRMYYILLQPYTHEIVVCNNNEYANIARTLKKQGSRATRFVYAKADPWRKK